jgi:plasmid stabilization system protein ParE
MTDVLPVDITALAAAHIREAEAWWRVNRPAAPNAIREEIERAFAIIAAHPHIGGRATTTTLTGVRRIHLTRIKYDLYFHVIEATQRVEVVALWHTRRGSGPPV